MISAEFEITVEAFDPHGSRPRWNGGHICSHQAAAARDEAVEAVKAVLIKYGLEPYHYTYGVSAREVPDA